MPQMPLTIDLAAVTYWLPGPQIRSTGASASPSPYASAAIACAPPMQSSASAPATYAAASVTGDGRGEATMTRCTPAARAVTAVMITDDGSG